MGLHCHGKSHLLNRPCPVIERKADRLSWPLKNPGVSMDKLRGQRRSMPIIWFRDSDEIRAKFESLAPRRSVENRPQQVRKNELCYGQRVSIAVIDRSALDGQHHSVPG